MSDSDHTSLPAALDYLQSFANLLGELEPEDRDESVDSSSLETTLRERLSELTEEEAEEELAGTRKLLECWLEDKPEHVGHWIFGFLSLPGIAAALQRPTEPVPRGPEILFEAPEGWEASNTPFGLDLKFGDVFGIIGVTDELSFHVAPLQHEGTLKIQPPHIQAIAEVVDVTYEECEGKKFSYRMTAPARDCRVTYMLKVPGGFVRVVLWTKTGNGFDELPIESRLHTLRVLSLA